MRATARHPWWRIYLVCVVATLIALLWLGNALLGSERRERESLARARHGEALRLALWQMDSWLAPLLAREAARPWYQYRAFYEAQEGAYTKLLSAIPAGSFMNRSPLLDFASDLVFLHCEVGPDGEVRSPQVPVGNELDLVEAQGLPPEWNAGRRELLQQLTPSLQGALQEVRRQPETLTAETATAETRLRQGGRRQGQDLQQRVDNFLPAQQQQAELGRKADTRPSLQVQSGESAVDVGPLKPYWPSNPPASEPATLWFLRQVQVGQEARVQGFAVDWPALRRELLARIVDALPEARLTPVGLLADEATAADLDRRLASVPARLEAPLTASLAAGYLAHDAPEGAWLTLLATSLAVAVAVVVVGAALRSSIQYGETRHRFASAVTHELRTPLTTFRMYSEMLAEDMVRDEAQRREYSRTLHREATRLSHLVENVLGFARLEEGRGLAHPLSTTIGALREQLEPGLAERCAEAGLEWQVHMRADPTEEVVLDLEALRQVLFNLVDNACKYAADGDPPRVEWTLACDGEVLEMRLRDYGPGIPEAARRQVFEHFDRGGRAASDPTPGIGLGLALARGLAEELGGSLELVSGDGRGTHFLLRIPRSATIPGP